MNVYEAKFYLNPLDNDTQQFLAENWKEAIEKTEKLLEGERKLSKYHKVKIVKLEELFELTEV